MNLLKSLKHVLGELLKDEAFLDEDSKNDYVVSELISFLLAYRLAKSDQKLELKYKASGSLEYNQISLLLDTMVQEHVDNEVALVTSAETTVSASLKNTKKVQRDKLEKIIKHLCFIYGIRKIEVFFGSDTNLYYRPEGFMDFQSATNVIYDLSNMIVVRDVKNSIACS